MSNARRVIATTGIVLALVLGGVGTAVVAPATTIPSSVSSKSASPDAWTHKVCQALSSWETNLKGLSGDLSGQLKGQTSAPGLRGVLTKFLQKVVNATGKLVKSVDGAGTPAVNQGKAVSQFFHNGLTQLKNAFAQSLKEVKALPNDLQSFATRTDAIGTQLDNVGTQLQGVFNDAQTRFSVPELDAAFTSDPVCQSIRQ